MSVLRMRLLHEVAFRKILPWFEQTKVISLKTQPHTVNACVKRSSQRSFSAKNRRHIVSLTYVMQIKKSLEYMKNSNPLTH